MIPIYIDYGCPFAWRGVELAAQIAESLKLKFVIRHYSLQQGNHPANKDRPKITPSWRLTEQPIDSLTRLPIFLAAQAARLQGEDKAFAFALALFRQKHLEKRDFDIIEAAKTAELSDRFADDLADHAKRRNELAEDLDQAAHLNIFGTPTFVLDDDLAYFRFAKVPTSSEEALQLWQLYVDVLTNPNLIETIKRPR